MRLLMYIVDAFTSRVFGGNPAGVVPLDSWPPDALLQSIAAENNLSETAFFVPTGPGRFQLRWFTPVLEMDLCGHATLAAAHVVLTTIDPSARRVAFTSRSGELAVDRARTMGDGPGGEGPVDILALNFPSRPGERVAVDIAVSTALGSRCRELYAARDYMAVYASEDEVLALAPNMAMVAALDRFAVVATAPGKPGSGVDFVSRFFAPKAGVPEDPVTGSAHCTLIPYWSARLGVADLRARQVSRRGGDLYCRDEGARVRIGGRAVTYLTGTIEVPV
jgi:predicted PhzF superfamily epimerase YddE/YHI9